MKEETKKEYEVKAWIQSGISYVFSSKKEALRKLKEMQGLKKTSEVLEFIERTVTEKS